MLFTDEQLSTLLHTVNRIADKWITVYERIYGDPICFPPDPQPQSNDPGDENPSPSPSR